MSRIITSRKSALAMLAYAVLLVIGAAAPMAASYAHSASAPVSGGEIRCGGFQRTVEVEVEAARPASAVRPPRANASLRLAQAQHTARPVTHAPARFTWIAQSSFRGS